MLYLSQNLKKYRLLKNLTQEEIADYLNVTPQSVSKWEREESCPDITFLPALANIFETSIDILIGMDTIRAEETRINIHKTASLLQKKGDYHGAEKIYRQALLTYPNKPGMILGLAGVLALQEKSDEAIEWIEKGLPLSTNEKQKATTRALLRFLYLKSEKIKKANDLASSLPHIRESREVIQLLIAKGLNNHEINEYIRTLLVGESEPV